MSAEVTWLRSWTAPDGRVYSDYDVGGWVMCDDPSVDSDGDLEWVEGAVAAWTAWRDFLKARVG